MMAMVDVKTSEDNLIAIFNETGENEEFLGFSDSEASDKENTEVGVTSDEDDDTDDTDSEDEDDCHNIVKRQRAQMLKKKQMLDKLMAELDQDPTFLKMKTCTPQQLLKMQTPQQAKKRMREPLYFRDPPVTRQRSGATKLHGPLTKRRFLTVKLSQKRKRSDEFERSPKRRHSINTQAHVIIPVEDVTPQMLDNIAEHSVGKHYDTVSGTSCHQCRQKTRDTKSCCRSETCIGIRGQFCGPCLKNRYGENVAEVLLDPAWECPVCRGFCNCSICRNRSGKCATGILIGLARQHGHSNVRDYLDSLATEQDDDEE